MKPRRLQQTRRAVQAITFATAVLLLMLTRGGALLRPFSGWLMRVDPLAAIAATIASRQWLLFWPALILLGLTIALGRFWCAWICPLGTLIDWTAPSASKFDPGSRARSVKYLGLFIVLFAALWGNLSLLLLDPLGLFVRTMSTAVLPGLNWLVTQAEIIAYRIPIFRGPTDALDPLLRRLFLTYPQPYYTDSLAAGILLAAILLLNRIAPRAWCRYLCPLGALLSLISRISWLRRKVTTACISCNACADSCPMGTIDASRAFASDSGECILCMDCIAICPTQAIRFKGDWHLDKGMPYDPSRRQVLLGAGISLGGLALFRTSADAARPYPYRLRPPGAEETALLKACIRCGACLRVCPTHGLQPSLFESGWEGVATPILVPRLGPCEYSCNACGQVCPTGAIPFLLLDRKQQQPIGKAYIDRSLCIAWSGRGPCIVCEEMCPLPHKAIKLEEMAIEKEKGLEIALQVPVVNHNLCIGCGLCENKCPVQGEAAIRVRIDPLA